MHREYFSMDWEDNGKPCTDTHGLIDETLRYLG